MRRGFTPLLSVLLALGAGAGPALASECLVLTQPLAAGEFLHQAMTRPADCQGATPDLPLRFDRRTRAPLAIEAISAGTYLGRMTLRRGPVIPAGEPIVLLFRHGPVAVERRAMLLLPARAGEPALVKTAEGAVLSLPFLPRNAGEAE